jgi:hypothetical protein
MKTLAKILFGASLAFAFLFLVELYSATKEDTSLHTGPASNGIVKKASNLGTGTQSDVYCAILLIPKPLVPLVKQLSRRKIAKGVKLLPAEMAYNQGKLVARSKEAFGKKVQSSTPQKKQKHNRSNKSGVETAAELKKRLGAAAMLAFLAGETKTKLWQKSTGYKD